MTVPILPDAYWLHGPWWAGLAFCFVALVVTLVIAPWIVQWSRGRPSALVSREQALASREAVLSKSREDALHDARGGESASRAELVRERARWNAEREALEADRDDGWDRARAMEGIAHSVAHTYRGLAQRVNALVELARQVLRGDMMKERAEALLNEVPPVPPLAEIPKLRDIVGKKPLP